MENEPTLAIRGVDRRTTENEPRQFCCTIGGRLGSFGNVWDRLGSFGIVPIPAVLRLWQRTPRRDFPYVPGFPRKGIYVERYRRCSGLSLLPANPAEMSRKHCNLENFTGRSSLAVSPLRRRRLPSLSTELPSLRMPTSNEFSRTETSPNRFRKSSGRGLSIPASHTTICITSVPSTLSQFDGNNILRHLRNLSGMSLNASSKIYPKFRLLVISNGEIGS